MTKCGLTLLTSFYRPSCFSKRGVPNLSLSTFTTILVLLIKACVVDMLLYGVPPTLSTKSGTSRMKSINSTCDTEEHGGHGWFLFYLVIFQSLVIWNYIRKLYRLLVPARAQDTNLLKCYLLSFLLRLTYHTEINY